MNWKVFDFDVGQGIPYVPRKKPWVGTAAAITAAGGLLGGFLQNQANASMDEETRDWQYWMWKQNNAYNHPYQQRHRLEQAGINPALAFQSGNTGVASSTPNVPQHTPADWSALGTGLSNAASQIISAKQVDQQNALMQSQKEAQDIENQTLHLRRIAEWQKLLNEADKTGVDKEWVKWQMDKDMYMYYAYRKKAYADIEYVQKQSALLDAERELTQGRNARESQQISAVIDQLKAAARASNSAAELSRKQAGIIPSLSRDQMEQIANAFVDEKLKNASSEEIAGFKFSGASVERLKQLVYDFLLGK